ncbi:MAG: flagellar biosynthesis protein FlhA [Phycisphaerales bacterium]|nr:flagellar biosynthesis protein FlhA [Phycisphaerales bacterium]
MDQNRILSALARNRGLLFPSAAAALIFVILIPLPTGLLDVLLVVNILLATVVMTTVMYLKSPLEFSSFPPLLLALTLLRLVVNIASSRLILTNATLGEDAAGHVIKAFGTFVAGNSLVVGVIIFIIITVIQFVVITKGATRIAEVAARFTLDGMPGKQMAIDADLNAGMIDEAEARRRRDEITREADFYGSMDGASKFVRGDAVAGLIITFVNVLGGLYVGMVENNMQLLTALAIFTRLTIGDGLAAQVPAFILSVGAGMLVARSSGKSNMGEEVVGQLFSKPTALVMSGAFLVVLALTPLPKLPLLSLAGACGAMAYFVDRSRNRSTAQAEQEERTRQSAPPKVETHLKVDALELQIGLGLIGLVDKSRGGDLLDRITAMRKQMAIDVGIVVPPVRIRDAIGLETNQYALLLRGQEVARGELYPDQKLAINSGVAGEPLRGYPTREPAFGLPAFWIADAERETAESRNYTVVEPTGVLATHLTEVIRQHAADLLTRAETQKLIDNLKQHNATVVDEVIPGILKVGEVQKALQNLLRERVPVRDLEAVLETLGDWGAKTRDVEILTEYCRNALARTICSQYRDAQGTIHCITLDPATEDFIQANIQRLEQGSVLAIPPARQAELAHRLKQELDRAASAAGGAPVVVLASPAVRLWTRRLIEPLSPRTAVLGLNEIVRGTDVHAHGVVGIELAATAA